MNNNVSDNAPNNDDAVITATQVPETQRLDFLPRHFGRLMLIVERRVYASFQQLYAQYNGGYWHFYELSNGGCYLAPSGAHYALEQPSNDFAGTVTGDAAGIIATLYAMSELSFEYRDNDFFAERYHPLRDFASTHLEAALIFRAID